MANEVELYSRFEALENRMAQLYLAFYERFKHQPELAKFWSEVALEEMQHASILRYCIEQRSFSPDSIDSSVSDRIEGLVDTVAALARKPDLTVDEAFYASLLVEASELDDVYSQLAKTLIANHVLLYDAIQAGLHAHHERFADAADRFLRDPAFVAAFRNLSKKHGERRRGNAA